MMEIEAHVILSFLGSVLILIVSIISWKFPAKSINHLYGYRTESSMRSQDRWDFAQKCSSGFMLKGSACLLAFQLVVFVIFFFVWKDFLNISTVINALSILPMLGIVIYKTEKAMKHRFKD